MSACQYYWERLRAGAGSAFQVSEGNQSEIPKALEELQQQAYCLLSRLASIRSNLSSKEVLAAKEDVLALEHRLDNLGVAELSGEARALRRQLIVRLEQAIEALLNNQDSHYHTADVAEPPSKRPRNHVLNSAHGTPTGVTETWTDQGLAHRLIAARGMMGVLDWIEQVAEAAVNSGEDALFVSRCCPSGGASDILEESHQNVGAVLGKKRNYTRYLTGFLASRLIWKLRMELAACFMERRTWEQASRAEQIKQVLVQIGHKFHHRWPAIEKAFMGKACRQEASWYTKLLQEVEDKNEASALELVRSASWQRELLADIQARKLVSAEIDFSAERVEGFLSTNCAFVEWLQRSKAAAFCHRETTCGHPVQTDNDLLMVRLRDLKLEPALNGQIGVVFGDSENSERIRIRLQSNRILDVRESNLQTLVIDALTS